MLCRECATENPDAARFCLNCGARLVRSSAEELGAAHLEPYLPRGMLAKLEGARLGRSMEGERRIVTMLFCDVKGSTAMAETLDPEEWAEIMNGAFELLIAPVYRYEGTLARLMGDAIFASSAPRSPTKTTPSARSRPMAQMQVELLPEPLRSVSSIQIALVSGRVAAARGDPSRAVEIADAILDRLRRSEIRQFVADALLLKGTSLAAADAAGEAERLLQEARSAAEELGCARILWEVLLELSRLAAARRNDQEATQLEAEARRLVKQIAETIDDDDLRSNFVSSTGVKPLLSSGDAVSGGFP